MSDQKEKSHSQGKRPRVRPFLIILAVIFAVVAGVLAVTYMLDPECWAGCYRTDPELLEGSIG